MIYLRKAVKKIIVKLIPISYTKRRHFHTSTYQKDNILVSTDTGKCEKLKKLEKKF